MLHDFGFVTVNDLTFVPELRIQTSKIASRALAAFLTLLPVAPFWALTLSGDQINTPFWFVTLTCQPFVYRIQTHQNVQKNATY